MPDSKITALASTGTGTDPANDPLVIVDVSDTSMSATGTTKKVTLNQLLATSPTATLASATITGDLTVDTSTLKVDSANNRVGIGTASPTAALDVFGLFGASTAAAVLRNNSAFNSSNIVETQYFASNSNTGLDCIAKFGALNPAASGNNYGQFYWQIANAGSPSTAMTLNSTGLGVGAGPGLTGGTRRALTVNAPTGQLSILELGINGSIAGYLFSNATQTTLAAVGSTFFSVETNAVERLRIDSSGNVGIGVTPATAVANNRKLEIVGLINSAVVLGTNSLNASARNWATASNWNAFGDLAFLQSNALGGDPLASGAGTTRMTLDASGRLLVGNTSAFTDLTGSKEVRVGDSGMQTLTVASLPAATATNIARGGVGGLVYVGGFNGTGQYGAVVLWTAASATVVSVINGTGSTITFGVSAGFLQITSSLVLTQVTASCIRI